MTSRVFCNLIGLHSTLQREQLYQAFFPYRRRGSARYIYTCVNIRYVPYNTYKYVHDRVKHPPSVSNPSSLCIIYAVIIHFLHGKILKLLLWHLYIPVIALKCITLGAIYSSIVHTLSCLCMYIAHVHCIRHCTDLGYTRLRR